MSWFPKHPCLGRAALLAVLVLWAGSEARASDAVFSRDYTYNASDADSKLSSRAIAMEQVKRILLEELGTYIKSETVIKNSELTKDEVTVLTAGVVSTNIIDERWDGQTYYIKVEIKADPDRIAESIAELAKEKESLGDLRESKAQAEAAMKEVERLRAELEAARAELENTRARGGDASKGEERAASIQKQYLDETNKMEAYDLWEKGHALFNEKDYDGALRLFDRALELDPEMARAYTNRGAVYNRTGRYREAVEDFSRAIELRPAEGKIYFGRSYAYEKLGKNKQAKADMKKSADLGFWKAQRKLDREGSFKFR